jgi:PEP-CTERM putative exosortase interaction domain
MNPKTSNNSLVGLRGRAGRLFIIAAMAFGPAAARAAVYTWSGANASNHGWLQQTNYVDGTSGTYTFTADDTIYFSNLSGASWTAPVFGAGGTIGTLHFGAETGSNPITITRANAAVVTVASGILVDAGAGANTITAAISLSGPTTTFTNNSSNVLVVSLPTGSNELSINGGAFHFQAQQAGSFTGSTTVNTGATLRVLNTATLAGDVTVKAGGTLGGRGTIGATAIESGGILAPGVPAVPASSISFSGSLTLADGSLTLLDLNNTTFDSINVGGEITFGGELRLTLSDDFFTTGDYALFNFAAGSSAGSFSAFNLYDPNGKIGELTLADGLWTGEVNGLSYSFDESTGGLAVTAVPEPGTTALAITGLLAGVLLRLRKRRSTTTSPIAAIGTR